AAARLAKLGSVVVRAAGNSGNNFYALWSMDETEITVANSMDDGIENNSIEATDPPVARGFYEAVEGAFTKKLEESGEITGRVVFADPPRACEDIKNAAALDGNIALIDRGVCFFFDKVRRAKEAGARAVLVVNNEGGPPIAMGTSGGTVDIPAMMITRQDGTELKAYLDDGLFVKLGGDVMIGGPELGDQLSPGSSRGPEYETHQLKPDLAAPGFNIHSARAGSGVEQMTGTSMASPHVAGAAALLLERHPGWTPTIVKAALMNTAVQTRDEYGAPYPET
ncbi:MAG: S8 family serine peptidase, partial [Verrucomicrobiota bacterium]|nr:S8 family serine peptidase [Verrucomicrobiota bacterium]